MKNLKIKMRKTCVTFSQVLNNKYYVKPKNVGLLVSGGAKSLLMMEVMIPLLREAGINYGLYHLRFPQVFNCEKIDLTKTLKKYLKHNGIEGKLKEAIIPFFSPNNINWIDSMMYLWGNKISWIMAGCTATKISFDGRWDKLDFDTPILRCMGKGDEVLSYLPIDRFCHRKEVIALLKNKGIEYPKEYSPQERDIKDVDICRHFTRSKMAAEYYIRGKHYEKIEEGLRLLNQKACRLQLHDE